MKKSAAWQGSGGGNIGTDGDVDFDAESGEVNMGGSGEAVRRVRTHSHNAHTLGDASSNTLHSLILSDVGEYRYIAPETVRDGRVSRASDIWSWGIIGWEVIFLKKRKK